MGRDSEGQVSTGGDLPFTREMMETAMRNLATVTTAPYAYIPGSEDDPFRDWAWLHRVEHMELVYLVKEQRPARVLFWLPQRPDWNVLYLTRNSAGVVNRDVEGWCMSSSGAGHDGLPLVRPYYDYLTYQAREQPYPYYNAMSFVRRWAAESANRRYAERQLRRYTEHLQRMGITVTLSPEPEYPHPTQDGVALTQRPWDVAMLPAYADPLPPPDYRRAIDLTE